MHTHKHNLHAHAQCFRCIICKAFPSACAQVCDNGQTFLACHIQWSPKSAPSDGGKSITSAAPSWDRAVREALLVMQRLHWSAEVVSSVQQTLPSLVSHAGSLDASDWEKAVRTVLQGIDDGKWSKVRPFAQLQ